MDRDFVIVWPWAMAGAISNMSYAAECSVSEQRCPLLDYRRTRPTCTCLAKTYFEDVAARQQGYKSYEALAAFRRRNRDPSHPIVPPVVTEFISGYDSGYIARTGVLRLWNASQVLASCSKLLLPERAQHAECWR